MNIHYLQAMGITPWRLRELPGGQRNLEYYYLSEESNNGLLIAEITAIAEVELLSSILKALGINAVKTEKVEAVRLLVMGDHLKFRYLSSTIKVTYSLAQILANPRLKGPVWQDLRDFLNF